MARRCDVRKISAAAVLLLAFASPITTFSQSSALQSHRQNGKLAGNVADTSEAPIRYAFVLVHGSITGNVTVKINERGEFDVSLAPGLYDVFVAADGFAPVCKKIEIKVDASAVFKPGLEPDSEHLQSAK
jgi:hypothetical protein